MSSLVLCHKQKATQPTRLAHIRYKIYTLEELAYLMCDTLYLLDHTLMEESFCAWIERELGLFQLADGLREQIARRVSLEEFILYFLSHTQIYTRSELADIKSVLDELEGQEEVEKQKLKADDLLVHREYENAVLAYQSILAAQRTEGVSAEFYGKVYACLGAAYGRLFLYREAAKAYSAAYQICDDYEMVRAYIYACRQYMSAEEYHLLLAEKDLFKVADKENAAAISAVEESVPEHIDDSVINDWKKTYREIPV